MAAAKGVKKVTVDGVAVSVDLSWIASWDGIRAAAHMQDASKDDAERLVEMVSYYEAAVPNVDEVSEQMAGRPAEDVLALLGEAVRRATPKN